jgi:putative PIG3 family NAD(P)H quinone oxidoreductase
VYAVTISEPGDPDVLQWTEVPDPEPQPGEVVIDVTATAVNRADLLQRQGAYPPPPGAPPYPGLECSGQVAATTVDHIKVGDEVCALLSGGGYAQKVAVPAGQVLPRPGPVALDEAGSLPEVACTVWSNVIGVGRLQPGETLLVHGGGSGIGTFAIQFAKAIGVTTITTARRAKHDRLRELGADVTIDYTTEDFTEHNADVILDIMGAAYLARNLATLNPNGRLLVIGMQGGRKTELDLGALISKRALVAATALRARPPDEKAKIIQGVREEVWPLLESQAIKPVVYARFPMTEAAEAHRLVESNRHVGKVLLVNPDSAA